MPPPLIAVLLLSQLMNSKKAPPYVLVYLGINIVAYNGRSHGARERAGYG